MKLGERPKPQAAINDFVVQIHASGFVPTELAWPSTWTDRHNSDRTPPIPGHELAGVVAALGYGTTGLSVGQRVFGLADWYRDGILAELPHNVLRAAFNLRMRCTSVSGWNGFSNGPSSQIPAAAFAAPSRLPARITSTLDRGSLPACA
jgi:alcohol dehydrogenase-like protein